MSKKQKIEIVQYYMSIHFGIAAAVDEIRALIIGEKEAWAGSVTTQTDIAINKSNLFGGEKKEGGLNGVATYLPGGAAQTIPEWLANKLGLTEATCPGYRGVSSIWFTGGPGKSGFYWSANQPRVPGTWVVARRAPKGLSQATAMIDGNDANPAHMIYEVITNSDWGIDATNGSVNTESFQACADTLFAEKFGLSLLWTESQSGEDFTSNILTYVDGVVFVNPKNGLLEMKLIRDDYVAADLFELNPSNSTFANFQRKLWGETVNEIIATWTNPKNEQEETVSVQDLANIAIQGGVVSDNNPYKGVRNADLAMKLATRDLRVASAPLASVEAYVNRKGWDQVPGSCVRVTWPQHGMVDVVMRIGNIDYGKIGDSKIKLALVEDVFSLDTQSFQTPPSTGWVDPSEQPFPLTYSLVFTLPYFFALSLGEGSTLVAPQVLAGVLGAQPGQDTSEFVLATETSDLVGNPIVELGTSLSTTSRATLTTPLVFEVESVVTTSALSQGDGRAPGMFAILGTTDEDMEICLVKDIVGVNVTLIRGVLDTTPKEWPITTPIWFIPTDAVIDDEAVYEAGETVEYHPLTVTSKGTLAYPDSVPISGQLSLRPWLPSRPANVKIGTVAEGTYVADELAGTIPVSWATRNRTMEDAVIMAWDDAPVTPESGQTTSILILDPITRDVVNRIDGLSGNSYDLPTGAFLLLDRGIVRVVAVKDGNDSLQGHEILAIVKSGYGYAYGLSYGN